jgi:phosphotransferase system HPr-like phosphotransfer protein
MIGKFEPSSKICHVCGYHNSELTPIKIENGNLLIAKQMIEILMLQLTSKNSILLIKI